VRSLCRITPAASNLLISSGDKPNSATTSDVLLARRGHQRCHCNEEGFGTLSRQLENDEGYRSSGVGVSGCFTRWPGLTVTRWQP